MDSTRSKRIAGLRHARAAIASDTDDATALAVAAMVIAHLGRDHMPHRAPSSAPCRSTLLPPPRSILARTSIRSVAIAPRRPNMPPGASTESIRSVGV